MKPPTPDKPSRASMAVRDLLISSVGSLIGPGSVAERVTAARGHLAQLDSQGLRQILVEERIAEQQAVMHWIADNRQAIQARAAASPIRGPMSEGTRVRIYRRDAFTCRYVRCRRAAIYLPVLRELASVVPDLLGTNPNWRPLEQHIVYWTCTST